MGCTRTLAKLDRLSHQQIRGLAQSSGNFDLGHWQSLQALLTTAFVHVLGNMRAGEIEQQHVFFLPPLLRGMRMAMQLVHAVRPE